MTAEATEQQPRWVVAVAVWWPRSAAPIVAEDSQRARSVGPLVAGDLVLDLSAIAADHERLRRGAREGAYIGHSDRGQRGTRGTVDRERLAEYATQANLDEAVAQQFTRALAGQSLAPGSTHEPEAEIGLARYLPLVGAVRRLQHPKADKPPSIESDPEAEARDLFAGAQSALVSLLDLGSGKRATVEVAENLRIGVELDFELEMIVIERNQLKPGRAQDRAFHAASLAPTDPSSPDLPTTSASLPPETARITQAELSLAATPVRSELRFGLLNTPSRSQDTSRQQSRRLGGRRYSRAHARRIRDQPRDRG